MAVGEEGVMYEDEGLLGLWGEELARREEVIAAMRETHRDILEPILAITDHAPPAFGTFSSTEAVEVYFEGLKSAVEQVAPAVIQGQGRRYTIQALTNFFEEVCRVPSETSRAALTHLILVGVVIWREDRWPEVPEIEAV